MDETYREHEMDHVAVPPIEENPKPLETILLGGLAVAVLDIANAMTFWWFYKGVAPMRILQSVAAGLLGREAARAGGMQTALLGAGLHVFIACMVAAVFYVGCRIWPAVLRWAVPAGLGYGVVVFAVMNHVVIPLSRIGPPKAAPAWPWLVDEITGHAVLIGLPVALIARWSARRQVGQA